MHLKCFCATFFTVCSISLHSFRVHPILKEPQSGCCHAKLKGNKHGSKFQRDNSKERVCFLEAGAHRYLGETGGLENRPELRGDWRLKEWEGEEVPGDTLRGLLRSPL